MSAPTPWYRTRRGTLVVTIYALGTVLALLVSTGWGVGTPFFTSTGSGNPTTLVPSFVYLYSFLGAMAYAFTSVVAKFERGVTGVVRVGLRALAALPLAAGVFLLAGALTIETGGPRTIAGIAFLVGLYVNLTLKALGGLADRLYGRTGSRDARGAATGPVGSGSEASGSETRGD